MTLRLTEHWNGLHREVAEDPSLEIFLSHLPGHWVNLFWRWGWTKGSPEVSSNQLFSATLLTSYVCSWLALLPPECRKGTTKPETEITCFWQYSLWEYSSEKQSFILSNRFLKAALESHQKSLRFCSKRRVKTSH